MIYNNIVEGVFISRLNRFVAKVLIDNKEERVHVKNTGRCRELLVPKAKVFLQDFKHDMRNRKLRFSLIAVEKALENFHKIDALRDKDKLLINMDSQVPNKVILESLSNRTLSLEGMDNIVFIKPEFTYENSRFDFYIEDENKKKGLIEVKGVTLESDGVARFPDAPTTRGVKHIKELISASSSGYNTYIIFLIQMSGVKLFTPNYETHKEFGDMLKLAKTKGVRILAYDSYVTKNSIELRNQIAIKL